MHRTPRAGWLLLVALLLTAVLTPWLLFDQPLSRLLATTFDVAQSHPWQSAALVVALLAADILLPVPSSLIGVFSGSALGFAAGAAALWLGLMAGCAGGYWLGGRPGRHVALHIVGPGQLALLESLFTRLGPALLVITRAVPVLAEASVVAAGAARMPLPVFALSSAVSNLGVALAWAGLGSAAASGRFLIVFLGLALLPAIGWGAWQRARRPPPPSSPDRAS